MECLQHIDPRLRAALEAELARRAAEAIDGVPRGVTLVLAGHRAAGKSSLLPFFANALGRTAIDLDAQLERTSGRSLREWVRSDEASFRAAERASFAELPPGAVVAVGGGFLSHHGALLRGHLTVLVPVTFETYCERLLTDASRPRLRPELTVEEELRVVFTEREAAHRRVPTVGLVEALLAAKRARARRVVTLPPGQAPLEFARRARIAGADLLELRTDLHDRVDVAGLSAVMPLLVAERGRRAPPEWRSVASLLDTADGGLSSHHAEAPMTTNDALTFWRDVPPGVSIKHVEPLGALTTAKRLFETQAALIERHGADRVTVLATGPLATAFRAVLAERNALDFLALDASWTAAPGQRLLSDALRAHRFATDEQRLAIIGAPVAHSRSPRIHRQPFDRLELGADVDLDAFLAAVRPFYRGFAVTAPLKKAAARASGSSLAALNTLIRRDGQFLGEDSDRAGALACLTALVHRTSARLVTVLGDGGVVAALRDASTKLGVTLEVRRHAELTGPISGAVVWTWPASVAPPASLRFDGATVAVIAYGQPALTIARHIGERGGTPLRLGPRWFVAQAREQRRLWETST